jgi:hypothetical protein
MTKRYDQLLPLIAAIKPLHVVEVGVHRGMRALTMCEVAAEAGGRVVYTGFDVFGTEDEAFHEEALNGKGMPNRAAAERRLESVRERWPSFAWNLVEGDTRKTLHGRRVACDFAFIDGDHRVEVIRGDAAALDCPVLVFDDYYQPGADGRLPDLDTYGANQVVEELQLAGARVEILPSADLCKHGGVSHLAVVRR